MALIQGVNLQSEAVSYNLISMVFNLVSIYYVLTLRNRWQRLDTTDSVKIDITSDDAD